MTTISKLYVWLLAVSGGNLISMLVQHRSLEASPEWLPICAAFVVFGYSTAIALLIFVETQLEKRR